MSETGENQVKAVLDFWLGQGDPGEDLSSRLRLWYTPDVDVDAEIRQRFGAIIAEAIEFGCPQWCDLVRGRLALVIVLDQFTRNAFRGTSRAFEGDGRALGLVKEGLKHGYADSLNAVERMFFYMPLEHSESISDQQRSVELFTRLQEDCVDTPLAQAATTWLEYAVAHARIIERFGRYPHRNRVLARTSTVEEIDYLAGDAPDFGQSSTS